MAKGSLAFFLIPLMAFGFWAVDAAVVNDGNQAIANQSTSRHASQRQRKTKPEHDKSLKADRDASMERAVQWAINIARDPIHGYSQGAVNATKEYPYTGSREGPDYDCSSFVYHALEHGGFNIINAWRQNPVYKKFYRGEQETGDADTLWADLQRIGGFKRYSWESVENKLRRGDILCNPKTHVAIYIGFGKTVEACGINRMTRGLWETGDQGDEIGFYDAYDREWTEVYRYTGK